MITISFFVDDEEVESRSWPCVPRVGEFVRLRGMPENMVVAEVCWCDTVDSDDEPIHDEGAVAVTLTPFTSASPASAPEPR